MTPPLASLTPDQRRTMMAELEGYTEIGTMDIGLGESLCAMIAFDQEMGLVTIPDYDTSLDAVSRVEAKLTDEQWVAYHDNLRNEKVTGPLRFFIAATAHQKVSCILIACGRATP